MNTFDPFTAYNIFVVSGYTLLFSNIYLLLTRKTPRFFVFWTLSYALFCTAILFLVISAFNKPGFLKLAQLTTVVSTLCICVTGHLIYRKWFSRIILIAGLVSAVFFCVLFVSNTIANSWIEIALALYHSSVYLLFGAIIWKQQNKNSDGFFNSVDKFLITIVLLYGIGWFVRALLYIFNPEIETLNSLSQNTGNIISVVILTPLVLSLNVAGILKSTEEEFVSQRRIVQHLTMLRSDFIQINLISHITAYMRKQMQGAFIASKSLSTEYSSAIDTINTAVENTRSIIQTKNMLLGHGIEQSDNFTLAEFLRDVNVLLSTEPTNTVLYSESSNHLSIHISRKYLFWILYNISRIYQDYLGSEEHYRLISRAHMEDSNKTVINISLSNPYRNYFKNGTRSGNTKKIVQSESWLWLKRFTSFYFNGSVGIHQRTSYFPIITVKFNQQTGSFADL